jgi:hypothetical protein
VVIVEFPSWHFPGAIDTPRIGHLISVLSVHRPCQRQAEFAKACPREGGDGLPGFAKKLRENKGL